MLITLKQKEIEAGLRLYLTAAGISLVSKNVGVKFTAGRTEDGLTATVDIDEADATPEPQAETTTPVTRAVKVIKALPVKEEPAPAASPTPEAIVPPAEEANDATYTEAKKPASLFG